MTYVIGPSWYLASTMKMSLRHPSGLEVEFEGDEPAFNRFSEFLTGAIAAFVRDLGPSNGGELPPPQIEAPDDSDGEAEGLPVPLGSDGQIDARAVEAQLTRVGASSEIERVTVIAHAAVEAGLDGIDYPTIARLYDDMGIPKPPRFPKAFSNAKERGLVKSVKYGIWATTVQGENFAKYGKRPTRRPPKRGGTGASGSTDATRELPSGGADQGER
jgi:hypothetical protein